MDTARFDRLPGLLAALGLALGLGTPPSVADEAAAKHDGGGRGKGNGNNPPPPPPTTSPTTPPPIPPPNPCAGQANGTVCGTCRICLVGACVYAPDDDACDGAGRCLAGVCNQPPTCAVGVFQRPSCDGVVCCNGPCVYAFGIAVCRPSEAGEPCRDASSYNPLAPTPLTCVGHRCRA